MKIMAVDFGDARTGLAVCDRTEFLASPIGVIHEKDFEQCIKKVSYAVEEYGVQEVVVGYPKNMNGTVGERAQKCELFSQKLQELVSAPVKLWDERSTTVSAIGYLNETNTRGKKRKEVIDAVAATIILESYLAYRKNHKDE
ncbi:putative Holliday junction resolvase [Hydrogenoanaerobacterium saccharovorans]|uniref:Putative pre-16S rRNA nuclease n=1 Tax=Hydrogenoanaerobacterium saccharovorans TaxID=474960 RepID=A0A1H8A5K9_9FIRM|nr:Holliday junction resolvase RuvX [Hydrogenoanaerobacterium saccharovorans]RPF48142.1 putative Holliday junction resolvase [Hydrogenoanaerobacterium saccharovorans]SEM66035.1 putative holliday junction resolvase [Hydrogenoanaerobacterium saccharovorans]